MYNSERLNHEFLPKIEAQLSAIHQMPTDERYDAITELIAVVSLSPDEKIKLRGRLAREFGYSPKDFNEAFACRFSYLLWEKVGRPN